MFEINPKYAFVVDTARDLFINNQISCVTIKDIAIKSKVGEATIYRHFEKKQNIVLLVGLKLQNTVYKDYFQDINENTGYKNIEKFS